MNTGLIQVSHTKQHFDMAAEQVSIGRDTLRPVDQKGPAFPGANSGSQAKTQSSSIAYTGKYKAKSVQYSYHINITSPIPHHQIHKKAVNHMKIKYPHLLQPQTTMLMPQPHSPPHHRCLLFHPKPKPHPSTSLLSPSSPSSFLLFCLLLLIAAIFTLLFFPHFAHLHLIPPSQPLSITLLLPTSPLGSLKNLLSCHSSSLVPTKTAGEGVSVIFGISGPVVMRIISDDEDECARGFGAGRKADLTLLELVLLLMQD